MATVYKQKTIESFKELCTKLQESGISELAKSRTRFEFIDRYIARESDKTSATLRAKELNRNGDKTVLRNFEPPIMFSQLDSAAAYFTEVFLSSYPIFGVVADKPMEAQATMMHAMMGRDSLRFSWARELMLLFGDTLSKNIGAIEVDWKITSSNKIINDMKVGEVQSSKTQQIKLGGNALHRLNPYNIFYDTSVAPAHIAEDGLFFGYIEVWNYIKVRRLLNNLQKEYKFQDAINEALKISSGINNFFEPEIRSDEVNSRTGSTNWATFFGFNSGEKYRGNQSGLYEVTKLFVRIIPKEFEIVTSFSGTPQVYCFYLLNGKLIYAEPMPHAHGLIPVAMLQAYDDGLGLQTKTFSENLMDIQDIATALQNGRLKSLRRAISDRGLYDSDRIRKADIDTAQPDAKIPVKLNQYHKDLSSAYYPIPFRDDTGATITQEFNTVVGLASSATGVNQTMQGNFVKGNRTLHEYDDVASNAQGRLRKMAVLWESTGFACIKEILKSNYLQYAIAENVIDTQSGKQVTIDPVKLREMEAAFKVSDGVLPSEKLINAQGMQFALQALSTIPDLARTYKASDMAVSLIRAAGMPDLSMYQRSPEEIQAYDQQQQQLAAAAQQQQTGQ